MFSVVRMIYAIVISALLSGSTAIELSETWRRTAGLWALDNVGHLSTSLEPANAHAMVSMMCVGCCCLRWIDLETLQT